MRPQSTRAKTREQPALRASHILFTAPFALAAACAPSLPVETWQVPELAIGDARALVVVEGEGRPRTVANAAAIVVAEAREDGYFDVDGDADGPALTLILDVYERAVSEDIETTTMVAPDGTESSSSKVTTTATVVIGAAWIDDDGAILRDHLEIEESVTVEHDAGDAVDLDALLDQAMRAAAVDMLALVTPTMQTDHVRLDDSDEEQRAILDMAQDGALEPALVQMRAYADAHAAPSADYNEGAILDALGRHHEALAAYDEALAKGPKDYYASTRTDCAARAQAAAALGR